MVLKFCNILTIKGGSDDLRRECLDDIMSFVNSNWNRLSGDDETTKVSIDTSWSPLDNALLEFAAKYLALDFEVEFRILNPNLEQWQGTLSVVDQELFYQDNFDAPEGLNCGNIYELKVKGGFPKCLDQFLDS